MESRTVFEYTPSGAKESSISVHETNGVLSMAVRGSPPFGAYSAPTAAVVLPDSVWRDLAIALNNEIRRRTLVKTPKSVGGK